MKKILFLTLVLFFSFPSIVLGAFSSPITGGSSFQYSSSSDDYLEFTGVSPNSPNQFYMFVAKNSSSDGGSAMACHWNFSSNLVTIWNGSSDTNSTAFSFTGGDSLTAYFDGTNAHCAVNGTDVINVSFSLPSTNNHYSETYNNGGDISYSSVVEALASPTSTPSPTPTAGPTPTTDPSAPTATPTPADFKGYLHEQVIYSNKLMNPSDWTNFNNIPDYVMYHDDFVNKSYFNITDPAIDYFTGVTWTNSNTPYCSATHSTGIVGCNGIFTFVPNEKLPVGARYGGIRVIQYFKGDIKAIDQSVFLNPAGTSNHISSFSSTSSFSSHDLTDLSADQSNNPEWTQSEISNLNSGFEFHVEVEVKDPGDSPTDIYMPTPFIYLYWYDDNPVGSIDPSTVCTSQSCNSTFKKSCSVGDWQCYIKTATGDVTTSIKNLFIPNFSTGILASQVTDIKDKLATKAPLGYVFFWVDYDWDSIFTFILLFSFQSSVPNT